MSEYTQSISRDGAYIHRPDGEMFPLVQAVYELNDLLARAEKAETALANREVVLAQMQSALHATYAETHHPDIGASERKPMMPHERIEWLGKDRDNWEARAKAAEAKLAQFWSSPSCSPEIVRCSQKSSSSQPTNIETISALQAATTSIPLTTARVAPDWQQVRIDAAIAALQGILAGNLYRELLLSDGWPEQRAAFLAVDYASMLTEELKKEVKE